MFPILHMGRPWLGYWLIPYPNSMWLWPQPRSPLVWDVFAVSTYLTVSLIFWFIGLIPDLATHARPRKEEVAEDRSACWPWAGADRPSTGRAIRMAYLLLAGLATPLVVSVHTVVSFDFAVSLLARLAHDHLSSLLRRRRHLLRIRHGADAGDSGAQMVSPGGPDHHAPPGLHGQGDAGHRIDRGLRLHDGSVHVLVQRQSARDVHVFRTAPTGPLQVFLLDADPVQYSDPAVAVVAQCPPKHSAAVHHFPGGQRRHVAGAIHHRHHQPGTATFCPPPGACIIRPNGIGRCLPAPSVSSWC